VFAAMAATFMWSCSCAALSQCCYVVSNALPQSQRPRNRNPLLRCCCRCLARFDTPPQAPVDKYVNHISPLPFPTSSWIGAPRLSSSHAVGDSGRSSVPRLMVQSPPSERPAKRQSKFVIGDPFAIRNPTATRHREQPTENSVI